MREESCPSQIETEPNSKMTAFWDKTACSYVQAAEAPEMRTASIIRVMPLLIALMMDLVRTSETSVYL
jgi:hypothetical protein